MSAPPYPVGNSPTPPYMGQQPPGVYPPHAYQQQQQQYAAQNAASTPLSQVELHISCRDLLDMDTFSKSDPLAVLYVFDKTKKSWKEYGRTEVIMDNLNPDFAKSFVMDYYFEEVQKLRFEVYDVDNASQKLNKQDFIGFAELNLGAILGENSGRYQSKLRYTNPKFANCGSIIITAEEVSSCKDVVTLQFCGRKLDKKDFFGKSDPFLTISRCNEDNSQPKKFKVMLLHSSHTNSFSVVHRTEVKKTTLKPSWLPFKLPARTLCNGDYDRTLKFECFDWNSNGSHSLIGEFQTCLRDLKSFRSGKSSYELINPKYKAKKKSYKNSGLIDVLDCKVEEKHSFLEYIRGGTELCFVVAIDFTASNGSPNNPSSLHYVNPYSPNQYVQALNSVGRIIEDYDSDKLFPAFGFGAKILSQSPQVQHQFALALLGDLMHKVFQMIVPRLFGYYDGNLYSVISVFIHFHRSGFNLEFETLLSQSGKWLLIYGRGKNFIPSNPNCQGVDGIVAAYYNCVSNCTLFGPTNFAPVINNTASIAEESAKTDRNHCSKYYVLLIITDGIITDMERTKEAIVKASSLPMSLIIVGVGPAEFDAMEELDGDDVRLSFNGKKAERDIVQFVPFRDYLGRDGQYSANSGERLAKDVLAELPGQLEEYMELKKIKPGNSTTSRVNTGVSV